MTKYLHHVPGRLRMRAPIFRLESPQRSALLRGLRAIDGVTGLELNGKAASVTVFYDAAVCGPQQILDWLESRTAEVHARVPAPRTEGAASKATGRRPALSGLGAEIGRMALSVLVNRGVTYSLSSLLGPRL